MSQSKGDARGQHKKNFPNRATDAVGNEFFKFSESHILVFSVYFIVLI